MFIDASVFVAILLEEPDSSAFVDAIAKARRCFTSPVAVFETVASLMRKLNVSREVAQSHLDALMVRVGVRIVDVTEGIGYAALDAFDRYGKGRGHPAQLNMGDCFAYACAKAHGLPLLYKGRDFDRTDLATERR